MRVLIAVALLMCVAALAQPAKQEKAQPTSGSGAITTGTLPWCKDAKFGELCMTRDGWLLMNFPFDLPAKEVEGPHDSFEGRTFYQTCRDVAEDWKLRSDPIRTGDGKYHCYAFYLLSPQR